MKYVEGLNYLDQLKDYVQTSLSIRQNVQHTTVIQKVEQSNGILHREEIENTKVIKNIDDVVDPLEVEKDTEDFHINNPVNNEKGNLSTFYFYSLSWNEYQQSYLEQYLRVSFRREKYSWYHATRIKRIQW